MKEHELERKIDIVDRKLDLLFKALLIVPFYTKAISEKNPRAPWNKAARETTLVAREYDEILKIQNENINDPSGKQT